MLLHNHSLSFKLIFTFSILFLTFLGRLLRFDLLALSWLFFFILLLLDGLDLFFVAETDLVLEVVSEVEHQVDEV